MTGVLPKPRHRWFAAFYDRLDRVGDRKTLALRKSLLQGVSGTVLEIGCGTGTNFSHYDWSQIESLEATEPDPFMLRHAREKLAGLDAAARSKLTLTEAPAEGLPFEDECFDVVVSCLVLCTVADPARSLGEIHRVLKPGGRLVISDIVLDGKLPEAIEKNILAYVGCVSGALLRDHYFELARRAGLAEIEILKDIDFLAAAGQEETFGNVEEVRGKVRSVTFRARKPSATR